jgi:hypothetical protein
LIAIQDRLREKMNLLRDRRGRAALRGTTAPVTAATLTLMHGAAHAADATWLAGPGSGDFNTANWTPAAAAALARASRATLGDLSTSGQSKTAPVACRKIVRFS